MFAFPLDQMVGGILFEHSHRMIASFVGLLTVILAVWLWRREERRWVRMLGFAALGAVIAQGLLGGLTVLLLLPASVSVAHATLAQTFFVIVSSIALVTSKWWKSSDELRFERDTKTPSIVLLGIFTCLVIYIQLILGALMRHTDSGLAIPDFPLMYGQILPSMASDALASYNQQLIQSGIRLPSDDPITSSQILIHTLHRMWALVVAAFVIWTAVRTIKLRSSIKRLLRIACSLLGLIAVQITLGAATVLSRKAIDITIAHVVTGAALLVASSLLTLHAVKLFGMPFRKRSPSFVAKEAVA